MGFSPYYLLFEQQIITNGQTYKLLRQINALNDRSMTFSRDEMLDIARKKASMLIKKQLLRNEHSYKLRFRNIA